ATRGGPEATWRAAAPLSGGSSDGGRPPAQPRLALRVALARVASECRQPARGRPPPRRCPRGAGPRAAAPTRASSRDPRVLAGCPSLPELFGRDDGLLPDAPALRPGRVRLLPAARSGLLGVPARLGRGDGAPPAPDEASDPLP